MHKNKLLIISSILFLNLISCKNTALKESLPNTLSSESSLQDSENSSLESNSNLTSIVNTSSSKETSSSNNLTNSSSSMQEEMTYSKRIDAYLDGVNILDNSFVNKIKELGPYKVDDIINSNCIYASPDGNGDGTFDNPYNLQEAIEVVKEGQTIYLRGGTYDSKNSDGYYLSLKGSANNYITIRPYQNEKVVITNSSTSTSETFGFAVDPQASYFIIEGLEIKNIKNKTAGGLVIWGNNQHHIIIRDCEFHHIEATTNDDNANAILLLGENEKPIHNVAIINNYVHDNVNGWSENISTAGNCEAIYVLENRVENNTNIGIDFYGNAAYCKVPSLDQPRFCVAAKNYVTNISCSYADCAGLYVDGARDIILQYNTVKNCQYGIEIGSEERQDDYPVKNIIARNNVCESNEITGIRIGGYKENETGVVKDTLVINNTFINNSTKNHGAEIIFAKVDNIEVTNNIFYKATSGEFISTDFSSTYTKNLKFNNNLIFQVNKNASNVEFKIFNYFEGIEAFNNKYNNGLIFDTFQFNNDYTLNNPLVAIDKGLSSISVGKYDYNLNSRVNISVDIGAIEY